MTNFDRVEDSLDVPEQQGRQGMDALREEVLKQIRAGWPHNLERILELAQELCRQEEAAANRNGHHLPPEVIAALAQDALNSHEELEPRLRDPLVAADVVAYLDSSGYSIQLQDHVTAKAHGQAIERIGRLCGNDRHIALGLMIQGDLLMLEKGDQHHEAWNLLSQAAECFLQAGDVIGWARTCTGRLGNSMETGHLDEALENAYLARHIFEVLEESDYYVRLSINLMYIANSQGKYQEAMQIFEQTLPIAEQLGEKGIPHLLHLTNSVGLAYLYKGQFHTARNYFEKAERVLAQHNKEFFKDVVQLNMAYIDMAHGNHKGALRVLHHLLGNMQDQDNLFGIHAKMDMAECYLQLNRNQEALELAEDIMAGLTRMSLANDFHNDFAHTLCHLAAAQTRLGVYNQAEDNLNQARKLFAVIGSPPWQNFTALLLAEIVALQGNYAKSLAIVAEPLAFFTAHKQLVQQTRALLLSGQCYLRLGRPDEAHAVTRQASTLARKINSPLFRYRGHLLLGQVQIQAGRRRRGMMHLRAAMTAIRRLQDYLTVTLRAEFMGDKSEAFHTYMALALQYGDIKDAFVALEQGKAQPFLDYVRNREHHYWRLDDPESQALISEFNRLREKHHFLYRQVFERALLAADDPQLPPAEVQAEFAECERRMKSLAEQLYLRGGGDAQRQAALLPELAAIQEQLLPETALVAYYAGEGGLWAFVVRRENIAAVALDTQLPEIESDLEKLHFNIACAIQAGAQSASFLWVARQLGKKLYARLISPLQALIAGQRRVVIVPYGVLHYVPFNILHDGEAYLIENYELVMAPAACLLTQSAPVRPAGALVLAHSYDGRLPHVHQEAGVVARHMAGSAGQMPATVYRETECNRACLQAAPVQILHIAAHGKQRLDRPELSYVHLADGQLFMDDLLQQDLSYELVVLSACETGRAVVKPGEELIGLGRGVLSAGAGAMVASMWPVEDEKTAMLMAGFYQGLSAGKSKAAALRDTQLNLLATYPQLHPAFWGAFQLVGNPRPLSG